MLDSTPCEIEYITRIRHWDESPRFGKRIRMRSEIFSHFQFCGYSCLREIDSKFWDGKILVRNTRWLSVLGAVFLIYGITGCKISRVHHDSPPEEPVVEEVPASPPNGWYHLSDKRVRRLHMSDHKHTAQCGHVKVASWWYWYRGKPRHIHGTSRCRHKQIGGLWHADKGRNSTEGALTTPPEYFPN